MSGISDVLIETLESLNNNDFDKFKKYLERHGPISRQKLEKASVDNTVYMMVQAYCKSNCGDVVSDILRKMNFNQLALDLEKDLHSESGTLELPEQMKQMKERMDKMDATMEKSNAQPHKNHKKNDLHHSSSSLNLQPPSPKVNLMSSCQCFLPKSCVGKSTMAAEYGSILKIVLLGHTGAGKSASGNTILCLKADNAFKSKRSPKSVTTFCEKRQGKVENRDVFVVDTPGINDTEMTQEKLKSEIEKCIEMCTPGPHALLLVIGLNRFTEEQQAAIKWIRENFGEGALKYTIVLFTGKDYLDGSVEEFISESASLQQVVHDCGGRYYAFNNREGSTQQVRELFSKIENMLKLNNADYYTKDMYKRTQEMNAQREKEEKENEEKVKEENEKNITRNVFKKVKEKVKIQTEIQKTNTFVWTASGAAVGAVFGGVAGACLGVAGAAPGAKAGSKAGAAVVGVVVGAVGGGGAGYGISKVIDKVCDEILEKTFDDH